MNERSTPEMDAATSRIFCNVSADFARKLKYERDEAKRKYDIEATEHMLNINKCCNQRDEAMDALMEIEDLCVDGEDACDDIQKIREIAVKALKKI